MVGIVSTAPTNLSDLSGAKPQEAGINGAAQAAEAPSPARSRLAALSRQVHEELFGQQAGTGPSTAEDAGEGDGEREEDRMVPVG